MAKKFNCAKLREHYNPGGHVYDCDTIITSSNETQLITDAVDHLVNDNITHSINETPWSDSPELQQNIEETLEDV